MIENNQNNGMKVRDFLVRVVLAVLFLLILIWVLPSRINKKDGLEGLRSAIFRNNIREMKDTALMYYTKDRLPKNIGDKSKITLEEMINKKLILSLLDKEGKACDSKSSYVEIVKHEKEYVLKINLKCGSEEDYILVPVGCYDYCPGKGVCEKAITYKNEKRVVPPVVPGVIPNIIVNGPSCELYVSEGVLGDNAWYLSNAKVGFKYMNVSTKGASIKEYGLGTNGTIYNFKKSLDINNDGVTKVYGYVKDSNGKEAVCAIKVKKDTVKPDCDVNIIDGIKDKDGYYIGEVKTELNIKNDLTSGVKYYGMNNSNTVTYNNKNTYITNNSGLHTIYGFVKDDAGNTNVCSKSFKIRDKNPGEKVSKPSCELEVTKGTKGLNNWYVSPVRVEFKSKTTTNGASIVSYGLNNKGKTYNNYNYVNAIEDGYYTVTGYVKDSNGYEAVCTTHFRKDATKPECSLAVESGTLENGSYQGDVKISFKKRYDTLSKLRRYGIGTSENYNLKDNYFVSGKGSHVITAYLEDNAGNKNTCSIKVNIKDLEYEHEYKKEIKENEVNWGPWITKEYDPKNPPKFGKTGDYEAVDLGYKDETTYVSEATPIYQEKKVYYDGGVEKTCDGFDYYRHGNTTKTIKSEVVKETTTTITKKEVTITDYYVVKSCSSLVCYKTTKVCLNKNYVPKDTIKVSYDYLNNNSSCNSGERAFNRTEKPAGNGRTYITKETTYYKDERGNTTSRIVSSKVIEESSKTVVDGVTAVCRPVNRPVKFYNTVKRLVGYDYNKKPVVTRKYYYKYRVGTISDKTYYDYKWSYYNDQNLINAGYVMTGNSRVKR